MGKCQIYWIELQTNLIFVSLFPVDNIVWPLMLNKNENPKQRWTKKSLLTLKTVVTFVMSKESFRHENVQTFLKKKKLTDKKSVKVEENFRLSWNDVCCSQLESFKHWTKMNSPGQGHRGQNTWKHTQEKKWHGCATVFSWILLYMINNSMSMHGRGKWVQVNKIDILNLNSSQKWNLL